MDSENSQGDGKMNHGQKLNQTDNSDEETGKYDLGVETVKDIHSRTDTVKDDHLHETTVKDDQLHEETVKNEQGCKKTKRGKRSKRNIHAKSQESDLKTLDSKSDFEGQNYQKHEDDNVASLQLDLFVPTSSDAESPKIEHKTYNDVISPVTNEIAVQLDLNTDKKRSISYKQQETEATEKQAKSDIDYVTVASAIHKEIRNKHLEARTEIKKIQGSNTNMPLVNNDEEKPNENQKEKAESPKSYAQVLKRSLKKENKNINPEATVESQKIINKEKEYQFPNKKQAKSKIICVKDASNNPEKIKLKNSKATTEIPGFRKKKSGISLVNIDEEKTIPNEKKKVESHRSDAQVVSKNPKEDILNELPTTTAETLKLRVMPISKKEIQAETQGNKTSLSSEKKEMLNSCVKPENKSNMDVAKNKHTEANAEISVIQDKPSNSSQIPENTQKKIKKKRPMVTVDMPKLQKSKSNTHKDEERIIPNEKGEAVHRSYAKVVTGNKPPETSFDIPVLEDKPSVDNRTQVTNRDNKQNKPQKTKDRSEGSKLSRNTRKQALTLSDWMPSGHGKKSKNKGILDEPIDHDSAGASGSVDLSQTISTLNPRAKKFYPRTPIHNTYDDDFTGCFADVDSCTIETFLENLKKDPENYSAIISAFVAQYSSYYYDYVYMSMLTETIFNIAITKPEYLYLCVKLCAELSSHSCYVLNYIYGACIFFIERMIKLPSLSIFLVEYYYQLNPYIDKDCLKHLILQLISIIKYLPPYLGETIHNALTMRLDRWDCSEIYFKVWCNMRDNAVTDTLNNSEEASSLDPNIFPPTNPLPYGEFTLALAAVSNINQFYQVNNEIYEDIEVATQKFEKDGVCNEINSGSASDTLLASATLTLPKDDEPNQIDSQSSEENNSAIRVNVNPSEDNTVEQMKELGNNSNQSVEEYNETYVQDNIHVSNLHDQDCSCPTCTRRWVRQAPSQQNAIGAVSTVSVSCNETVSLPGPSCTTTPEQHPQPSTSSGAAYTPLGSSTPVRSPPENNLYVDVTGLSVNSEFLQHDQFGRAYYPSTQFGLFHQIRFARSRHNRDVYLQKTYELFLRLYENKEED